MNQSREFLEYYAQVCQREAEARVKQSPEFACLLRSWAERARHDAAQTETQADLFMTTQTITREAV
jgi:hypothetical protein